MSANTRRQFLEVAGLAVAATVLAPVARAAAQIALPVAPGASPAPVGPGAPYSSYQSEIYIAGMATDTRPIFTTNLADLEDAAAKVLSKAAQQHLLAEAGGVAAAVANAQAAEAWRIVPRMLIDRAKRDVRTTLLGVEMPAPVLLGPVAQQALVHRDAEAASARAAAALGLTYVHSSRASTPVEGVALAAPGGPRWLALDWPEGREGDRAPFERARRAGCTHLLLSPPRSGRSWPALATIRAAWGGPIVLGGVQSVTQARRAIRRGFDGIVVSNERGRHGRVPSATLDRLAVVVAAVAGEVPVLFGSGIRTGTDVFRALALGADAVLVGRPYVHGLALGGEPGVRHVLRTLLAELDITLAVAGPATLRDLGRDALARAR